MAMRDLIPWSRQESSAPALYRDEERSPFVQLRREIDRMFDDVFRAPMLGGLGTGTAAWPRLEVNETDDEIRVTAELPGMREEDVELFVQDGMLTVRGERKEERDEKDRGWSERYYGQFERSVTLPDGADEEHCEAEFRDGMLRVRMPKSEQSRRGRRIPIKGEGETAH